MPTRIFAQRRDSNSSSECSDESDHSRSTAPTLYSIRPSLKQNLTAHPTCYSNGSWDDLFYDSLKAPSSVETYASTVASEEDLGQDDFIYEEPESVYEPVSSTAVPSTPPEFADFFPSTRRLCIRHDDTVDGNMNLRVDTERHMTTGNKVDLTLFHLRMHDLKNRDFSLRRYCRESGREVCHSGRKYTKPASERRPGLHLSVSNALATLRSKSESKTATMTSFKRQDSGYESMDEDDYETMFKTPFKETRGSSILLPTNTTQLEFSNYAHLDLKRRGTKSSKRYEFDYWGTAYAWKRITTRNGQRKETSYHLYNTLTSEAIAHIVPTPLTPTESRDEEEKGGWVPPCSMWISDEKTLRGLTDVADVIVATGLMALVDDCIKSRWHHKDRFQFPIPMPMLSSRKMNMEYIGPKRLIDEVFHRRGNTATRQPTPLRQTSAEA
ncbi:hypothetical protein MMC26_003879 [Xylographa opegraphella]|nr:hypothetical protein [Xylographa opegraphella]